MRQSRAPRASVDLSCMPARLQRFPARQIRRRAGVAHLSPGRSRSATRYCLGAGGPFERQARRGREPPLGTGRALHAGRHQRRGGGGARRQPAPVRPRCRRHQECGRTRRGARRPEGPDHEGGPADGHHPRGAAAGVRRGAGAAAIAGPADGAGLRAPAHDGGAGARLGGPLPALRAAAGGLGVARPGAPRDRARRRDARRQAAVSRHAVGRGGGPQSAQDRVRPARAHEPGHRYGRDAEGDRGAAARGARLRPGVAPHGALRADLQGRAQHPRPRGAARAVDQAPAHHDLARRPAPARLQGGAAGGAQHDRARHVPRLVVSRSPTTA